MINLNREISKMGISIGIREKQGQLCKKVMNVPIISWFPRLLNPNVSPGNLMGDFNKLFRANNLGRQ
jgi:hypothetical protein